ncbi:MAG: ricin-type beta-trefoil lectin domain protein [Chitinophagaceae bacterium]|nr:ricin-type beta-trefoil lectin domain protein [Oligoflexus sp.]
MWKRSQHLVSRSLGVTAIIALSCATFSCSKSGMSGIVKEKNAADQAAATEPTPAQGPTEAKTTTDTLSIPSAITGVLLTCFQDEKINEKQTVICGMLDSTSFIKVDLTKTYSSFRFESTQADALTVAQEPLSSYSKYHVRFTITAKSTADLDANIENTKFSFNAVEAGSGRKIAAAPISRDQTAPVRNFNFIRNSRARTDGTFRCMDNFSWQKSSYLVQTYLCNTRSLAQDWFVTPDNKIAHALGRCLTMGISGNSPTASGLPVDCSDPTVPTWTVTGPQIRQVGTNNCLAENTTDIASSGDQVSVLVLAPCDGSSAAQKFAIGSY